LSATIQLQISIFLWQEIGQSSAMPAGE